MPLPEPSAHDVEALTERIAVRIERVLRARDLDEQDGPGTDTRALEQPALGR